MKLKLLYVFLFFACIGILDAVYLTSEHYSNEIPPCSTSIWVDCGKVLGSKYAMFGPLPVAVLGLVFYSSVAGLAVVRISVERSMTWSDKIWQFISQFIRGEQITFEQFLYYCQLLATVSALAFSAYFVYLQLAVLQAICIYCMVSAVNSVILFSLTMAERHINE